jgi:hypothetical protein
MDDLAYCPVDFSPADRGVAVHAAADKYTHNSIAIEAAYLPTMFHDKSC